MGEGKKQVSCPTRELELIWGGEGEKQTTMRMKTAKGRGSEDEKQMMMRMNTAMVMAVRMAMMAIVGVKGPLRLGTDVRTS